jgi:hypothetical protein
MSREFHPRTFGLLRGTTSSEVREALIWEPLADSLSDRNSVGRFRPKGSVSVGQVALPFAASENQNLRRRHSFSTAFCHKHCARCHGYPGGGRAQKDHENTIYMGPPRPVSIPPPVLKKLSGTVSNSYRPSSAHSGRTQSPNITSDSASPSYKHRGVMVAKDLKRHSREGAFPPVPAAMLTTWIVHAAPGDPNPLQREQQTIPLT